MRALILAATLALFGFAFAGTAPDGDLELRISAPHHGVTQEDLSGQGNTVILAGPRVSVVVGEDTSVRVDDLNSGSVSARLDRAKGWTVWEGGFEVELVENEEVKSRFRVQGATMILGRFVGSEGWTTEDC